MVDASTYAFQLAYQVCPIVLTGGIAQGMPGGAMPMIAFTEALSFASGLLSGGALDDLDQAWATFQPAVGGTLIAQKIGLYPFANQYVAANAVIFDPLTISMLMICPARQAGDMFGRQAMMSAFQATLAQHNQAGGLYTVATPAFTYTNCVMLNMTDVSTHDTKQVQDAYQLDFMQPLVSLDQAAGAQNALMSSISNGTPTSGATSGVGGTVGSPSGLSVGSVVPSASPGALGLPNGIPQATGVGGISGLPVAT